MKKIALSFILSFSFIFGPIMPQVSAWNWGNSADYGNFQLGKNMGGKVYESGDSIGYQGFGNYSFRIKSYQPTPWWNIQPP